jgi:hypothetical protein
MGAGLIGVWQADLRSRQHRDLIRFSEAVRFIAVFYDGVVVPGALILLFSGAWFTVQYFGGWNFIKVPWLTGMIALFAFEFIEGNTITRLYFMKLRRMTNEALAIGEITPELERERSKLLPSFTHYLDLPMLFFYYCIGCHEASYLGDVFVWFTDSYWFGIIFYSAYSTHVSLGQRIEVYINRIWKRQKDVTPRCSAVQFRRCEVRC